MRRTSGTASETSRRSGRGRSRFELCSCSYSARATTADRLFNHVRRARSHGSVAPPSAEVVEPVRYLGVGLPNGQDSVLDCSAVFNTDLLAPHTSVPQI